MHATKTTTTDSEGARSTASLLEMRFGDVDPRCGANGNRAAAGPQRSADRTSPDWHPWAEFPGKERLTDLRVVSDQRPPAEFAALVAEVMGAAPALQTVTLVLPGRAASSLVAAARQWAPICQAKNASLVVDFVLADDFDAFASLAQSTGDVLSPIVAASQRLRESGLTAVRWLIPVSPASVFHLEGIFSLARDANVTPVLVPSEAAGVAGNPSNDGRAGKAAWDADRRLFVWDFVTYRLLEEQRQQLSAAEVEIYSAWQQAFSESPPGQSPSPHAVAVLEPQPGQLASDWHVRVEQHRVTRLQEPSLLPDSAHHAASHSQHGLAAQADQVAEVGGVLWQGNRAVLQWLKSGITGRWRPPAHVAKLRRVLVIGAYGGEHIGDTAILGGVLHRIHQRYGVTDAVLMSQRARHSRHLVDMLDSPVRVRVEPYEHARIRDALQQVDAVVFAGGPLMDLPKQLVLHLYSVSLARQRGLPFIVEGIGAGPFKRQPSAWVGRRLVTMASSVSVRTKEDGEKPLVRGLDVQVGHDPAFDYLATRPEQLTRLRSQEPAAIDALLRDTEDRPRIGINLRPIRHMWTETADRSDPVQYTRRVEVEFERQFAEGLRRFDRDCPARPCFVFYPMNAIQFGMSDLRSAYRIGRLLGRDVDFRVWQADASLDGVVALLRRLDLAITMRFHATIFALAAGLPVVGIDYRIGKRDKVAALLSDRGQSANCTRIDELTADWLCQRIGALCHRQPADMIGT